MTGLWGGARGQMYPGLLPADYYLYKTAATPTISTTMAIGDKTVAVVSSAGVVAGQAITFYEGVNMFQTLVKGTTATEISLASPADFAFTGGALVEAGAWSMDVDGSTTPQIFSIKAPPEKPIHIVSLSCSMLDATAMDDGLFGGMAALTEGILFRFENEVTKNLAVIVNNIGFWEIGFETEYSDKAPAGQYGFRAQRSITGINGVILDLGHNGAAEFQIHIRDDLTGLDLFSCVAHGHMTGRH